jgi:hypothetical protein
VKQECSLGTVILNCLGAIPCFTYKRLENELNTRSLQGECTKPVESKQRCHINLTVLYSSADKNNYNRAFCRSAHSGKII